MEKLKVVSLPKDGKVCFELFDGTILRVPMIGIRMGLDYINHGAMLPHDSKITISVCAGFVLVRFEDTGKVFQTYDERAPRMIDVTIKVTVGEILDVLKSGWIIA